MIALYCIYGVRIRSLSENKSSRNHSAVFVEYEKVIRQQLGTDEVMHILFSEIACKMMYAARKLGCIDEAIAINKPLTENVFIMLHSFLAGIPTFICGRPGTSKSVAIQVVENILKLTEDEKK